MNSLGHSRLAYVASFLAVVVGLAVLLVAEFVGVGRSVVVAGGVVSVVGVAVLTAAVATLPKPEGTDH
jgi:hypothetical protein